MEIGTTIISTHEYMELRAMKDNLEARKAEIEANADKIFLNELWRPYISQSFISKDEALKILADEILRLNKVESDLHIKVSKNGLTNISRTIPARLHFLFTGNITKVKGVATWNTRKYFDHH